MDIVRHYDFYNYALALNHYYQTGEGQKIKFFQETFNEIVNEKIQKPEDPFEAYLLFTANRGSYKLQEALRLEKSLLSDLRKFFLDKKEEELLRLSN